MTEQQSRGQGLGAAAGEDELPPLAPGDASADERARAIMARMVARLGAPSLNDYRRTYDSAGLAWPGDEEIRRRHPVADDAGGGGSRGAASSAA